MPKLVITLKERKEIAAGTMAFTFDTSADPKFTFDAGQNVDLTLIDPPQTDAEGNTRTFSFASSPTHRGEFMIATRMRPTAFKSVMRYLPIGTALRADGPNGNMTLHEKSDRPAVFLTGGIGITPFRSMIEWATVTHQPHELYLLYSNRTPDATAFLGDFETWSAANPKLHLMPTVTESDDSNWPYGRGKIDEAMIRQAVPDATSAIYYLAGPPAMVEAMKALLKGMKISKDDIRSESFSGY
ncbi:MAG: FAD-dependent oxidoreductase [Candidatus Kerfeldbacteria bacterium]|nr:FAD-dependent oxidoreductase [Candidatus Kerfeldbacteria bacterium]